MPSPDDYFQDDDDDLGDLPEEELHALEVAATFASTQRQQQQPDTAQQQQWTTAPQQQQQQQKQQQQQQQQIQRQLDNEAARQAEEARQQYLARIQERRLQASQRTSNPNPTRASATPAPVSRPQPSRPQQLNHQQQQYTHQQRQLQPRQPYYQPTATYITQPTMPSTIIQRGPSDTRQYSNYANQTRIQETSTIQPPHEEVIDPEQYNAFDQTVELSDAAGPTALAPQEQLPGGGAGVVEGYPHERAAEEKRRREQERYEALAEADQTDALMGNSAQTEEMARMRAQLQQLLNERNELQENLKDMQDKVLSKTGEASILRSNLTKVNKEHERVIASMNALYVEEREKHKRELDSLQSEQERMKTESLFLKREVDDMATRNRTLEKKKTIPVPASKDLTATPKKNKIFSFRDGFDDDEIMHSPTKASGGRIRGSPAKSRVKRKRPPDSPISQIQLPVSQPSPSPARGLSFEAEAEGKEIDLLDEAMLEKLYLKDDRFEFYQAITTHRMALNEPPTLEKLSQHKFPSEADASISSIFLEQMTLARSAAERYQFPVAVCRVLFSLWTRCIKEDHFQPLTLIQTLLYYCLQISPGGPIYTEILDDLTERVMAVVDINGEARVRKQHDKLRPDIDVTLSLELLDYLAMGLKTQERSLKRLWKTIRSDFPVMMLHIHQPLAEKTMMLSLLQKSVFSDSFGSLTFDTAEQEKYQSTLLNVVGTMLSDTPPPEDALPEIPHRIAVVDMRIECIKFAGAIVSMDDGVNKVAVNPFISKMVSRICDEIDEVYDYKFGAKKSIEFINAAMRLLYGIIQTQTVISLGLTTELMAAPGGLSQKYVVAITRLAFAEEWMQELGLEDDVIEAARDILENSITPDEAEALWSLFQ